MSLRSGSRALPDGAPTDGGGRRGRRLPAGLEAPFAAGSYRATVLSRRCATAVALVACLAVGGSLRVGPTDAARDGAGAKTTIRYIVVVFQENVSFDHYFATYPQAANPPGEPAFRAAPRTPAVDNLQRAGLLAPNNRNAAQPFRLARSRAATCSQNHAYWAEQAAADGGAMDLFAGQTHGASPDSLRMPTGPAVVAGSMVGDGQPRFDDCSMLPGTAAMSGRNVGDLLNARGVTWGWFQGGFA